MKLDTALNAANENSCQDACCRHDHEGQGQASCDHQDQTDFGTINNSKIVDFIVKNVDFLFKIDVFLLINDVF